MILSTHALVGAVIGKNISNPWLIIIVSIAFHFLIDTFRHGEYLDQKSKWTDFWKVAVDIVIGGLIIVIIAHFSNFSKIEMRNVSIGVFFSMFPDFLTLLNWKLGVKSLRKYYDFHGQLHKYPRFSPERIFNLRNATNDIAISVIAIIFLLLY